MINLKLLFIEKCGGGGGDMYRPSSSFKCAWGCIPPSPGIYASGGDYYYANGPEIKLCSKLKYQR